MAFPRPRQTTILFGVVTDKQMTHRATGGTGASLRSQGIIARELVGKFQTSQLSICLLSNNTYWDEMTSSQLSTQGGLHAVDGMHPSTDPNWSARRLPSHR
jgi:hypothetical protein